MTALSTKLGFRKGPQRTKRTGLFAWKDWGPVPQKRVGPLQLYLERSETGLLGSCLPSQRKTAQPMKLTATGRKSLGAMSPLAREFDLLPEFTPLKSCLQYCLKDIRRSNVWQQHTKKGMRGLPQTATSSASASSDDAGTAKLHQYRFEKNHRGYNATYKFSG